MKITLLCSDTRHPVNSYLEKWIDQRRNCFDANLVRSKAELKGGDILFLISCSELVGVEDRSKYRATLVLHASDLPKGRGWSPHVWELVSGAESIFLSLLEAADAVDSGRIWKKVEINIPKHALWDEINHLLFSAEIDLMDFAVSNFSTIHPCDQDLSRPVSYYPKRTPEDSRLDAGKTIQEQFDLIRVCDPVRFPAFFEYLGCRYAVRLEKIDEK